MFKKRCFAIDSETQTIRAEKGSGATSASELIVWQSWQTLSSPNGLWFRTSPYSYRVPGFRSPFLFSIRHPVTVWVTDERNPRTTIYPSIFVWFFFVHFSKLTSLFLCEDTPMLYRPTEREVLFFHCCVVHVLRLPNYLAFYYWMYRENDGCPLFVCQRVTCFFVSVSSSFLFLSLFFLSFCSSKNPTSCQLTRLPTPPTFHCLITTTLFFSILFVSRVSLYIFHVCSFPTHNRLILFCFSDSF